VKGALPKRPNIVMDDGLFTWLASVLRRRLSTGRKAFESSL